MSLLAEALIYLAGVVTIPVVALLAGVVDGCRAWHRDRRRVRRLAGNPDA